MTTTRRRHLGESWKTRSCRRHVRDTALTVQSGGYCCRDAATTVQSSGRGGRGAAATLRSSRLCGRDTAATARFGVTSRHDTATTAGHFPRHSSDRIDERENYDGTAARLRVTYVFATIQLIRLKSTPDSFKKKTAGMCLRFQLKRGREC